MEKQSLLIRKCALFELYILDELLENKSVWDQKSLNKWMEEYTSDLEEFEKNIFYLSYLICYEEKSLKNFDFYITNQLNTIFNNLNNNSDDKHYLWNFKDSQFNPTNNKEIKINPIELKEYIKSFEKHIFTNSEITVSKILNLLEESFVLVPSVLKNEFNDVSLFDSAKNFLSVSTCIHSYITENKKEPEFKNIKEILMGRTKDSNEKILSNIKNEAMFLLTSFDISGIQSFIYTIIKENALKSLRARSLYLELIMEAVVKETVNKVGLSEANIIYSGGGHAYLLLPNTEKSKLCINESRIEVNKWFLKLFNVNLFIAMDYTEADIESLTNKTNEKYESLFLNLSSKLSSQKLNRYTFETLEELNSRKFIYGARECKICKRVDELNHDSICSTCSSIIEFSRQLIKNDMFVITDEKIDNSSLSLPFDNWITCVEEKRIMEISKYRNVIRIYSKNRERLNSYVDKNLMIADYSFDKELEDLTNNNGIKRLSVLRADIDNLGDAFVNGFNKKGRINSSLLRTSVLSRNLSVFFKQHIQDILRNPIKKLGSNQGTLRKIVVIYSGGDDLFVIGDWSDVLGFAIDLNNELKRFSQNSLSISAGLGIYPQKYPISYMADDSGELEEYAKKFKNGEVEKNAVCIFESKNVFSWEEFELDILNDKLNLLSEYLKSTENTDNSGNSFLYKLLEYMNNIENKINIPRLLYLLARKKPKKDKESIYLDFNQKIYNWIKVERQRKELIMAIIVYVYLNRGLSNE